MHMNMRGMLDFSAENFPPHTVIGSSAWIGLFFRNALSSDTIALTAMYEANEVN